MGDNSDNKVTVTTDLIYKPLQKWDFLQEFSLPKNIHLQKSKRVTQNTRKEENKGKMEESFDLYD